jgi:hypothetical protein
MSNSAHRSGANCSCGLDGVCLMWFLMLLNETWLF